MSLLGPITYLATRSTCTNFEASFNTVRSLHITPLSSQTNLFTYRPTAQSIPSSTMDDKYCPNTNLPIGTPDEDLTYAQYQTNFEFSDFLEFNDWINEEEGPAFPQGYNPQNPIFTRDEVDPVGSGSSNSTFYDEGPLTCKGGSGSGKEMKKEIRDKVAFKTRSEIEILDDGFKWRKYGKKMVKNSPNPRNYYKCSVEGCSVKKRVERDNKDPNFVVTTYEGIHNHQGPLL